jgi:hypothetical protein
MNQPDLNERVITVLWNVIHVGLTLAIIGQMVRP